MDTAFKIRFCTSLSELDSMIEGIEDEILESKLLSRELERKKKELSLKSKRLATILHNNK